MNDKFIFNLDVSDYELVAINDLIRMFTLQMVVQILFYLRNEKLELFSLSFLENTLFILLGLIVYWFVVNKLAVVTNKKDNSTPETNYFQNNYAPAK